eukprot:s1770_g2.t1
MTRNKGLPAIRGDGSVESWGHHGYGGTFFMEKEMLQDVRQVKASYGAFAALLSDGTACVLSGMDSYDVLRCRTADDVYSFFQAAKRREAERSGGQ